MNDPIPHQLEPIEAKIDQLFSLMEQLLALHNLKPAKPVSPFLPLREAAEALNTTDRALRTDINKGLIPPHLYFTRKGAKGMRSRYFVDVVGYYAHLRSKGSR